MSVRVLRKVAILLVLFLFVGGALPAHTQTIPDKSAENTQIHEFLLKFLAAFDDLDWPAFRACFSDAATVFHPAPPNLRRTDSPEQFERAWLGVFDRIKKGSGRTSPPYMDLRPEDLRVENLAEGVALVTFHLTNGNVLSRRTLILKKDSTGWKIVHIHASNLNLP